ncbi:MAG: YlmH/Sll1252 family protein [Eubacteriales bacterium]|nr:YlmH/Sll1252 family protein [Eubacteriales bacterium]
MNREEELFQKRLRDLASMADRRGIVTYTEFLNLNELNIFHSTKRELAYVSCQSFGGYEHAERQIIAFIPDALSYNGSYGEEDIQPDYPISCIRIAPLNERFLEKLTHRDYLGAVLNLGILRSAVGDILVTEKGAWLFSLRQMADFICNELSRVKNTTVRANVVTPENFDYTPKYELVRGSVASIRLDSLLALAFGASRSSLTGLIEGGRVFVNGRLVTSNGYKLKENDIISARGYGRFRYVGIVSGTRKGRLMAEIEKFV